MRRNVEDTYTAMLHVEYENRTQTRPRSSAPTNTIHNHNPVCAINQRKGKRQQSTAPQRNPSGDERTTNGHVLAQTKWLQCKITNKEKEGEPSARRTRVRIPLLKAHMWLMACL